MTTLREAAQQALEALESSRVFVTSREKIKHPEGTEWYDERIAALRAALAQEQAEPVVPQAEPLNLSDRAVQRRLAAQWGYVPAQAEPTQEPVALLRQVRRALSWACAICDAVPNRDSGHLGVLVNAQPDGTHGYRLIHDAEAALTEYLMTPTSAPPRRTMAPLTNDEIDAEWHELDGEASALFKRVIRKFARAVEKASWEKNHG